MKELYLLTLALCGAKMCFATPEDIEILLENYKGESLASLDIEPSEQNIYTLSLHLESWDKFEKKAYLLYSYLRLNLLQKSFGKK